MPSIGIRSPTARIAGLEKQSVAKKSGKPEIKVGEKGGVSLYGLGRFPVTPYYEQGETPP
jgi:hypothetical protein